MNQPELGNYIAALRKEQGLTQEELVEKCNINVRTIQRIEAGEVTPRSYTVRNILEALGKSIDDVFKKVETKEDTIVINYNTSLLGWGIIAGIFYLIIGTLNIYLSLAETYYEAVVNLGTFKISLFLEFISVTVFLMAIAHFGKLNKISLIKNTAYGSILFLFALYILEYFFYQDTLSDDEGIGIVLSFSSLFLYGLMYLFLAVGFFINRNTLGEAAKWLGIIGMVGGISYCVIILFPIGIIATIAFEILLILLLYKTWDQSKLKKLQEQ
jgi:transcriptional regulator with XRE-family HTH domain